MHPLASPHVLKKALKKFKNFSDIKAVVNFAK